MYHKSKALRLHQHFIMYALEKTRLDTAFQQTVRLLNASGTFFQQHDILRADDQIHRLVLFKSRIHAIIYGAEELNDLILLHDARDDIALTDKIGDKGVGRFIVDIDRRALLENFTLIHNNDGI